MLFGLKELKRLLFHVLLFYIPLFLNHLSGFSMLLHNSLNFTFEKDN